VITGRRKSTFYVCPIRPARACPWRLAKLGYPRSPAGIRFRTIGLMIFDRRHANDVPLLGKSQTPLHGHRLRTPATRTPPTDKNLPHPNFLTMSRCWALARAQQCCRTASSENDGFDHVIDDAQNDAIKILGLLFTMEEMNLALTNWQTILRILATPFEYSFGVYQHHALSDASSDSYMLHHICRDLSDSRAPRPNDAFFASE